MKLMFFLFSKGGQPRRLRLAVSALLLTLATLLGAPARADVWGFVDSEGTAHYSSLQLDERYELFFRGQAGFRVGQSARNAALQGKVVPTAPPRLVAFFDVSPSYKAVKHLLREASATHGIDYELLQAVIATESGFNANAVSPKGAVGLMQLIPPTAERYGVRADKNLAIAQKLTDPKTNIRAGSRYLSDLIKLFPGQMELALAAYNAGEGAVQRAGNKIPNYPETKNYVKTVMQLYGHLKPPPLATLATTLVPGRVRLEMMGGKTGRSNRVPEPELE